MSNKWNSFDKGDLIDFQLKTGQVFVREKFDVAANSGNKVFLQDPGGGDGFWSVFIDMVEWVRPSIVADVCEESIPLESQRDIDWSQYKPGDLLKVKLGHGIKGTVKGYFVITECDHLKLRPKDNVNCFSIKEDYIVSVERLETKVRPLRPGDGGYVKSSGFPFVVPPTNGAYVSVGIDDWMDVSDPGLVWTRRGGVQVKQP